MVFQNNSKDVLSTLKDRVSIREHISQEIDDTTLHAIIEAARRSPTSSNLQAYSFVVVRNQETKRKLAVLAGNQKHIETASVFIAICADIARLETAAQMHNTTLGRGLENTLVATIDAALAGMSLSLAADSLGIGNVMVGGMRNHPKKVAELLGFPKGVYVVFGMSLGWPDHPNVKNQKPRFDYDVNVHYEKYNSNGIEEKLRKYDRELSEHYKSEGRNTMDSAWTGIIADRFSQVRRPELKGTLEDLGFLF